jgi:hypothetical protein
MPANAVGAAIDKLHKPAVFDPCERARNNGEQADGNHQPLAAKRRFQ